MVTAVAVKGVTYRYDEAKRNAVTDVTCSIGQGECVALLGPNGSGKTTLIKHVNGLLKAQSGEVSVMGMDVSGKSIAQMAHHVGYVFQNPDHMIFADSVEEEISFGPKNLGMDEEELKGNVSNVLEFTALERYRESHPMSLSGGEKQRLALASIIVSGPEILILDEPTTGLDYNSVQSMISLVKDLKKEGKTIIIVTHDMGLVSRIATRCIVMKGGRIVADGSPTEIFSDKTLLSETYLEQPPTMVLSELWGRPFALTPEALAEEWGAETRD